MLRYTIDLRTLVRGRVWLTSVALLCLTVTAAIGSGLHVAVATLDSALEQELDERSMDVVQVEASDAPGTQTDRSAVRVLHRQVNALPHSLVEHGTARIGSAPGAHRTPLIAVEGGIQQVQPINLRTGRWWTASEARGTHPVALLGYRLADSLMKGGRRRNLRVGRTTVEILGTLASGLTSIVDVDRAVVIPSEQMRHVGGGNGGNVSLIVAGAPPRGGAESFYDLWGRLQRTRPDMTSRLTLYARREQIGDMGRLTGTLESGATGLSVVLASASLVSVIALMTTIGRLHTRTVGLTRAMGATRRQVTVQGAAIGAVIGVAGVFTGELIVAGLSRVVPPLLDLPVITGHALWWAMMQGAWVPLMLCALVGAVVFARLARRAPSALLA